MKIDGAAIPLLFASPGQINAVLPPGIERTGPAFAFELVVGSGPPAALRLNAAEATPGIFSYTVHPGAITLWATGLGPVQRQDGFDVTRLQPAVRINGISSRVLYSGLSPGFPGLYQVNVELPPGVAVPGTIEFEVAGYTQRLGLFPIP